MIGSSSSVETVNDFGFVVFQWRWWNRTQEDNSNWLPHPVSVMSSAWDCGRERTTVWVLHENRSHLKTLVLMLAPLIRTMLLFFFTIKRSSLCVFTNFKSGLLLFSLSGCFMSIKITELLSIFFYLNMYVLALPAFWDSFSTLASFLATCPLVSFPLSFTHRHRCKVTLTA